VAEETEGTETFDKQGRNLFERIEPKRRIMLTGRQTTDAHICPERTGKFTRVYPHQVDA
jgi:hypothetical protein